MAAACNTKNRIDSSKAFQFLGVDDCGETCCPHCGADGRYIYAWRIYYRFILVNLLIMGRESNAKKNERLKKATLKWLNYLADDYLEISLSYTLSDEDTKINNKDSKELEECIEWLKKQKTV